MNRTTRIVGPGALLVVAFAALLAALAYGGGAQAPIAIDPGALVRYGLPISTTLVDLSEAGVIGALVLCSFAFAAHKSEFGRA
ncbi:MAG: hypothetical protein JWQ12_916, partial [Glaciihabitans sp.]|nr:hypothetical protein [Glaciihabitans sp.]